MSHQPGDNLTILNATYHRPVKGIDGKRTKDYIILVYKNLDTGKKEHKIIYNPKYTYYRIKDEYVKPYPQHCIEIEKTVPITVKYDDLLLSMAKDLGKKDEYFENIRNGDYRKNRDIHLDPRVMASDIGIEAFYRMEFDRTYKNEVCPIDKAYLDIEADIKYIDNRFPEPGECPVNAVSLTMEKTKTEYVFLLRDSNNPLIAPFEDYLYTTDFPNEFKEFLTNAVGGWKNMVRLKLNEFQYKVVFYDDEIDLISAIFRLINVIQPDFVLSWNMSFDITFLIERIRVLGYSPEEIMCHPDFKEKTAYYFTDQRHINERAERTDYADITSYSVYLDQMIQFASRRKGQSAFTQFNLDYIGQTIVGVRKLDYHNITNNLGDLPYIDYKTFVMYNMMDTMVQKCIEEKTGDINYVFNKAILNSTEYSRVHRQTVYLANRAVMFYRSLGLIIGNNTNKNNEKPEEKFAGAYVAPPGNVSNYSKVALSYPGIDHPVYINLAKNGNDFDYTALYPSEAREHNIAPNTMIGKIILPNKIYAKENIIKDEKYERAGEFVENFASRNWIDICQRYMNLASYSDMIKDVLEYFTTIYTPYHAIQDKSGMVKVINRAIQKEVNPLIRDKFINVFKRTIPFDTVKYKAKEVIERIEL